MRSRWQPVLQMDAFAVPSSTPAPARESLPRRILEPAPQPQPIPEPQELWLGVHLPGLAGMPLAQGAPGQAHRQRRLLERLATRAFGFTSRVSLAPPDGLLLEIKGSVRLFRGAENICELLAAEHRAASVQSVLAVAPTPLAALARARASHETLILDHARLVGSVSSLPLVSLRWPEDVIARLGKMGVYTAGQALRLPRAGFARRFGSAQLASLDRLTGRLADPRIRFMPRERFRRIRDLPWELETHEALLRALGPMLEDMENFLRARQAGITVLECRFRHRNVAATPCILHLAAPAADAQRLGMLLGERLSSIVLPAPVRSCELRTDVIVPLAQACHSLWQPGEHGGEGTTEGAQLIEYLRARLSAQAVHGVQLVPDHRPEKASCVVEPRMRSGPSSLHSAQRPRPLWLLAAPQSLSARAGQPWYHGPLQIELPMDKERIEATSWEEDFKNLARDYYVAVDVRQVRLWIFRERTAPHRWFLHGVFG